MVELKTFTREREAVVFTFAFPVLLLVIFGAVFGRQDVDGGVTFAQVFVAGMIAAGLLASSFQNLGIAIPIERDSGALKRLAGTPMPSSAYFVGKIVLVRRRRDRAAGAAARGRRALLRARPADRGQPLADLYLWVSVLGISACTLLGIAITSIVKNGRTAPAVISPIAIVLQFISGVFFVFAVLPQWTRTTAAIFPLKSVAPGMRSVFLPDDYQTQEPAGTWSTRIALVLGLWLVGGLFVVVRTFRRRKTDGRRPDGDRAGGVGRGPGVWDAGSPCGTWRSCSRSRCRRRVHSARPSEPMMPVGAVTGR